VAVDAPTPGIVQRLQRDADGWMAQLWAFQSRFRLAAGGPELLPREALAKGRRWLQGSSASRTVFEPTGATDSRTAWPRVTFAPQCPAKCVGEVVGH